MTVTGSSVADNGAVLTLDPGQRWKGVLALSGALSGAIGSGAQTATPAVVLVTTAYTDPIAGAVLARIALSTPAVGALSLVGTGAANSVVMPEVAVANYDTVQSATIRLQFNGATVATAVAVGDYF